MIFLTLPEPPSSNRFYRNFRGRMVMSTEGKAYKSSVYGRCLVAKIQPLTGDLSVTLKWFRARKSGDLDNRGKIALDSLQGHCYENDSQIVELHLYRDDDESNPRLEVTVEAR